MKPAQILRAIAVYHMKDAFMLRALLWEDENVLHDIAGLSPAVA